MTILSREKREQLAALAAEGKAVEIKGIGAGAVRADIARRAALKAKYSAPAMR